MFGSTSPFGQSSTSPFGSQPAFGQTSNAGNNPFASNPFGTTSPFGQQSGSSIFGGNATGVFGTTSSPFSSTTTFGPSSSPAFGSSTPAFGASSSTFGTTSPFGGSSVFGQKPAFGGFGSTSTQMSPFGSSTSQPGSSLFGSSTPFAASSTPAFGSTSSTPAFGSTSTLAFGAASTPAFGATSTPAFGATSGPAFGTTAFGSTGGAFGASTTPAFGASSTPAFGTSSAPAFGASVTPAFGAPSTSAFGASSTPAFGVSSSPAFGVSTTPSFGFGSSPGFGQSSSAFGSSSPFGASSSVFGSQSSPFGAQSTTPTFGSTGFGQTTPGVQRGGSRVTPYTSTTEADATGALAGKLESICAMPAYKDKSHEELRWEDYQLGDKGGQPSAALTGGSGFGSTSQPNPFSGTPTFGQSTSSPFAPSTSTNPFAPKPSTFSGGFGSSSATFSSSPFGVSSSSGSFGSNSSLSFGSNSAFGSSSSAPLFGSSASSGFGSSPSLFNTSGAQGTTPFSFGNTQPPLFTSTTSSFGQQMSVFGQTPSGFGSTSTPSFGQTTTFNPPSTGFGAGGGLFSSTSSLIGQSTPSFSSPFQPAQPAQVSSGFGFGNLSQPQTGGSSGSSFLGQNNFGQSFATQSAANNNMQPVPVTNPFGNLPAMPQISIGKTGGGSSVHYGISCMPVVDKPIHIRTLSLLTPRHLLQRRVRSPARKYHPDNSAAKFSFSSGDEETHGTPKADALFIPRENPRALVINPIDKWIAKATSPLNDTYSQLQYKGKSDDKGPDQEGVHIEKVNQESDGAHQGSPSRTPTRRRASDEAATIYEHGADIESVMPKLEHSDYYTEPSIKELAAKERAQPGFCRRVKDFVVGRHGYGSIKFFGETDVRQLDLESIVQFNHREVVVYMDDNKKPPVGKGLNKPAEVTLLNIKCFDKKTGQQCTGGPRIEKYKEILKKKAEEQDAEVISYDPVKGEWKFRVNHFSKYSVLEEEDD